jgi:TldD protein
VQDVCICNTEGVFVTDRRVRTRLSVNAIASNGTENQTGSDNPGASMGFEIFDNLIDPEKVVEYLGEMSKSYGVTLTAAADGLIDCKW